MSKQEPHRVLLLDLVLFLLHYSILVSSSTNWGFPDGSAVKNLPAKAGDIRDLGLIPGQENLLEKEMATHSGILAWEIHGQRSLAEEETTRQRRLVHGVSKSWTQLNNNKQGEINSVCPSALYNLSTSVSTLTLMFTLT